MYKQIIAGFSVAAIAGSVMFAAPAFADDSPAAPTPTSTDTSAPAIDNSAPTTDGTDTSSSAPVQATPEFKADFAWTVPTNPNGDPYTTCTVSLYRANGELAFSAPYPADLPKLTLEFGTTELTDDPIVPGTTGLSMDYTCTNGTDTSDVQTINSIVVPDVPPTAPTVADATATGDDGLAVQYGGSQAVGVAPLDGYSIELDRNGAQYMSQNYNQDGTPVAQAQSYSRGYSRMSLSAVRALATTAGNPNGVFSNLPAGIYTVKVRAFNSVGLSDAKTAAQQIVVNSAGVASTRPTPNNVRNLKLATTKNTVKLSWQAPVVDKVHAKVARYTVIVSLNGKTVATKTLAATKTSLTVSKLKANKRYQVRINAYGLGAAEVHIVKQVSTKKH